jgi:hypothetical protein
MLQWAISRKPAFCSWVPQRLHATVLINSFNFWSKLRYSPHDIIIKMSKLYNQFKILVIIVYLLAYGALTIIICISYISMIKLLIFLIQPIKVYIDFQTKRYDIVSENKCKAGVYILYNNSNDSYYVGSSNNIASFPG